MFTQEKQLAMFDAPVKFRGRLAMEPPDRLRWEFTSPIPSALIFNGSSGLRCSDGAEPAHFSLKDDPVMKVVAEQLWLWLGGDYSSLENRYLLEKKGEASLLVTPLQKRMQNSSLQFSLSLIRRPCSRSRLTLPRLGVT